MKLTNTIKSGYVVAFFSGVLATALLLFAVALWPESPRTQRARVRATLHSMKSLAVALNVYKKECGATPTEDQTLQALAKDPGVHGWNGPYIWPIPRDAWGRNILYHLKDNHRLLSSSGKDGRFGTEDDITLDTEQNPAPYPEPRTVQER